MTLRSDGWSPGPAAGASQSLASSHPCRRPCRPTTLAIATRLAFCTTRGLELLECCVEYLLKVALQRLVVLRPVERELLLQVRDDPVDAGIEEILDGGEIFFGESHVSFPYPGLFDRSDVVEYPRLGHRRRPCVGTRARPFRLRPGAFNSSDWDQVHRSPDAHDGAHLGAKRITGTLSESVDHVGMRETFGIEEVRPELIDRAPLLVKVVPVRFVDELRRSARPGFNRGCGLSRRRQDRRRRGGFVAPHSTCRSCA